MPQWHTWRALLTIIIKILSKSLNKTVSPVVGYKMSNTEIKKYLCSPTRYTKCFNEWVLLSPYISSTYFGIHRSIIRNVSYKLYSQTLVCGNTRTTRHAQPLQSNGWTCRVVRTVVPHTKSARTVWKNAPEVGPVRSETCRANISAE